MIYKTQKPERKNVDGTTVEVGMPLVDKNGNFIGKVKEIQEKGFLVDRSSLHFEDLFVPYWVCLQDGPGEIKLEIAQNEVNQNVWRAQDRNE